MKKVTLLGDSIRLLYGPVVAEELAKEGIEAFQPEENCRFAKYTLRLLFDYRDQIAGSEIVHWNAGLWDVPNLFGDGPFTSLEEYVRTVDKISSVLLQITPKVIFATTTPVRDGYLYQSNEDISSFNSAVLPMLKSKGILINDLYTAIYPRRNELIREDDLIHPNDEGTKICAHQVLSSIHRVL